MSIRSDSAVIDSEKQLKLRILKIISITMLVSALLAIVISLGLQDITTIQILIVGVSFILLALGLAHYGYLQAAGVIVLIALIGTVFFLQIFGLGAHDLSITLFPIIIILASILLSQAAYFLIISLIVFSYGCIVYLELTGQLQNDFSHIATYSDLAFMTIILMVTAVAMRLLTNNLWLYLRSTREKEASLIQTNKVLARQKASLQKSEDEAIQFQEQLQTLHEIGFELSQINTLDELYFQAIQMGRNRLTFDRLGLLLFDADTFEMSGTYGTNEAGEVVDESDYRQHLQENSSLFKLLSKKKFLNYYEESDLYSSGQVVGRGWRATTILWNGEEGIGWLSADNLLSREAPKPHQLEILTLYGTTVGNLITRLRANLALEENESEARIFQERLHKLHEINLELASVTTLDELYRLAVTYGRERLGFERMGLFLLENNGSELHGTYGTDEFGQTIDERTYREPIDFVTEYGDILSKEQRFKLLRDVPLFTSNKGVGKGWNALTAVWDGDNVIGILAIDNHLTGQAPDANLLEVLTLYGADLGHLITRKKQEDSLMQREASARAFQEKLNQLHEINLELSSVETLDELYYQAVTYGRERLGFERVGLFLINEDATGMYGTYGTDEKGQTNDEKDYYQPMDLLKEYGDIVSKEKRFKLLEDAPLYTSDRTVGKGWNALTAVWDGDNVIGILAIDNYFSGAAPDPNLLEIFTLYGTDLGYLITRKRQNETLRQSEAEARLFQEKLQALHEISLDLADVQSLDALYRLAVVYGRERLGFDRLGLLLYDQENNQFTGTFGTDRFGNIRDERAFRQEILKKEVLALLETKERFAFWPDVTIQEDGQEVGTGWIAMAVLWNGDRGLGWLAIDNLLKKEKPSFIDFEILTLYGATLGHLLSIKLAEESLKSYAAELERSNEELQTFAFVSSHDLQEPLRKIQTFGDRLADKYAGSLDDKGLVYLERMRVAAARMQTLIEDLLTYSRVQTRGKTFAQVNLNEVLAGVLSDLEVVIEEKKAEIVIEPLPIVEADEFQMRQLFQNLISNALKFSRTDVKPRIDIRIASQNELSAPMKVCQIMVSDNGIGFDERFADRIFVMFQRLHGQVDYEGSGLGLALCKRIVTRHNGRIYGRSVLNEGSTFTIILPIHQPQKSMPPLALS